MSDEKDTRRIACIAMESIPKDIARNAEKIKEYMKRAADAGAQLAAFPEMSLMGYVPDACELAIKSDSPVLRELAKLTGQLGIAASVGYFEDGGDKKYVAQAFLHKGRVASVYRKIYSCEHGAADGVTFETADWDGATIATTICKDLHFPSVTREHVKRGALLVLQPSAYRDDPDAPFDNENHNVYLPRARAKENGVFFVHLNACGTPRNGKRCFGKIIVVAPDGRVVARIDRSPYSESMLVVDVDLNEARNSGARKNITEELDRCGLIEVMPPGKQGDT